MCLCLCACASVCVCVARSVFRSHSSLLVPALHCFTLTGIQRLNHTQLHVDSKLSTVEGYQVELHNTLVDLETGIDEMTRRAGSGAHTAANIERERTYTLASTLDNELQKMGDELAAVVQQVRGRVVSGIMLRRKCAANLF